MHTNELSSALFHGTSVVIWRHLLSQFNGFVSSSVTGLLRLHYCINLSIKLDIIPDSKVHGANMGSPGSCRPQMGPMLVPWILLSRMLCKRIKRLLFEHSASGDAAIDNFWITIQIQWNFVLFCRAMCKYLWRCLGYKLNKTNYFYLYLN